MVELAGLSILFLAFCYICSISFKLNLLMIKKIAGILFLSVLLYGQVLAHSGKPKFHVIIDTDGAFDDLRSISMFLAQNDIRVLGITTSQGTLLSEDIANKVADLLSVYHHEGIPVGIGDDINDKLPLWAPFSHGINWGSSSGRCEEVNKMAADVLLRKIFASYPEKITLVALGSLKTYADLLKEYPEMGGNIERIVWYNEPKKLDGFNYTVSPESFEFIKKSGIRLDIVGNDSPKYLVDDSYISVLSKADSPYARHILSVTRQPEVASLVQQKHFILWDDIIPLYLTVPVLFESEKNDNIRNVWLNENLPASFVNEAIVVLLQSATITNNRVFERFPIDTALYKSDYAEILQKTLLDFGAIEWKAVCLTNEVHGHTGIYSIIGAKLGVRAMEFFNVGVNNLSIKTFSGNKPPLSCFNDGIQISCGATIGQGLITIADTVLQIPTAIVEFNKQKVEFSLKPEIAAEMRQDIKYGVENFGLESEMYWIYIEKLAIKYWEKYNRNDLFTIRRLDAVKY